MAYVPFSLRYRPQSFAEIIGQEHVSRTLQNAVGSGRVVHAYLFAGPRGTGKTSTARVLAKALLCDQGPTPEPCGECPICRAIAANRALDVMEIDAASNRGIEQIRDLREKVRYSPAEARAKVYILDEVHMLTPEAFNALLKTLEEPPAHAYFILATTELHKVPPTIVSRCQLFEFHLIGEGRIVQALQAIAHEEGVEVEPAALEEIARAARGALRDAESIFDQAVAYAGGPITVEVAREVLGATPRDAVVGLLSAIADSDLAAALSRLDALVSGGKDLAQLLQDVLLAVRDMLRVSLGVPAGEEWGDLAGKAREIGPDRLAETLRLLGDAEKRLRDATQQQVSLELSLAEIAHAWARPTAREAARAVAAQQAAAAAGRQTKPPARRAPPPQRLQPAATDDRPTAARPEEDQEEEPPAEPEPEAEPTPAPERTGQPAAREAPPSPRPSAPAGPPPADAGELARRWEEVHLQLKRMRRVAVWALLKEARPVSLQDDTVTLRFDTQWEFHCNRISGPYRSDVEAALSAVFGRPVTVRCLLGDVPTTPAPSKPAPEARQAELPTAAGPRQGTLEEQAADEAGTEEGVASSQEEREEAAVAPLAPTEDEEDKVTEDSGAQDDPTRRAVELTLELFEDSEELPPE